MEGRLARRRIAAAMLALVLCLTGCMTARPLRLRSWMDFRYEMLRKYGCIRRLEGKQYYPWLNVNICYSGETLPEEVRAEILDDCKAFLSGDAFLDEYIPYSLENISDDEIYVDPPMPDIVVEIRRYGADERGYRMEASYYKEGYRSDQEMTVDRYQTWYQLD